MSVFQGSAGKKGARGLSSPPGVEVSQTKLVSDWHKLQYEVQQAAVKITSKRHDLRTEGSQKQSNWVCVKI